MEGRERQGKKQALPEFQSWVGALLWGSGLRAGDELMNKTELKMQSQIPPKMNGLHDLKHTIIPSILPSFTAHVLTELFPWAKPARCWACDGAPRLVHALTDIC